MTHDHVPQRTGTMSGQVAQERTCRLKSEHSAINSCDVAKWREVPEDSLSMQPAMPLGSDVPASVLVLN